MNDDLMVEFTVEEVRAAVYNIPPLKASGMDGFLVFFYQKYWHVVRADITNYYLAILRCLGCCMGIRTSVSIWNDCWLSRPSDCKVQHVAVTTSVSWVSDLMVPGLYKWDEVKIYDIFVVDEAERILSIPLAQFGPLIFLSGRVLLLGSIQ
ncbi:hypothetical protein PVK06_009574 [Gossypium arboreum]|uniref:Uncharacterized protein n=1 Tax=Gossypium arboreum TaxID=29729 RepID=A0ABR0QMV7_GOSAR|nr:hypothetical protein PVK06_009574 [Gossypium arboreum]